MDQYRKKPIVIKAIQVNTKEQAANLIGICTGGITCPSNGQEDSHPHIHTLEGNHTWSIGDYLIEGVKGEYYFCKPDIFELTYEKVEN